MATKPDDFESLQKITVPKNGKFDDYARIMDRIAPTMDIMDLRHGYLCWLKGACLVQWKCSKHYKRGDVKRLYQRYGISKTTAHWYMLIAGAVDRKIAMTKRLTEMLYMVRHDLTQSVDDEGNSATTTDDNDGGKGKGGKGRALVIKDETLLPRLKTVEGILTAAGRYRSKSQLEDARARYADAINKLTGIAEKSAALISEYQSRIAKMAA